jgi:hypothetical protein
MESIERAVLAWPQPELVSIDGKLLQTDHVRSVNHTM